MKKAFYSLAFLFLFSLIISPCFSQDIDEILTTYFENTGGHDNWGKLKGVKMLAKVSQQDMEIPVEIVQLSDGKQYSKITFQGMTIMQGVFNGEILWGTNFQTMKPEQSDAETTEIIKKQANDFPDPFLNYKGKGYAVELLGDETIDGTETFKVKLTKEPIVVDGQEVEDVAYYYFDKETFIPVVQESQMRVGPQKGEIQQIKFSDFQEVEGLMFPFSMSQGIKDGPSQPILIESIELNPEVDPSVFDMPVEE
jgi:hypothetical protein